VGAAALPSSGFIDKFCRSQNRGEPLLSAELCCSSAFGERAVRAAGFRPAANTSNGRCPREKPYRFKESEDIF